jgi:DNA-binding response OmpR family regulator
MKRRILLVDDEVAVLLTLKAVLEISGFDVDTAASAREGKSKLRQREYSMVITDMRMERESSGREVIAAARAAAYRPAIALLTAFPVSDDSWEEVGADKMLVKPMQTRVLLQQIEKLFASHEAKKSLAPQASAAASPATAQDKSASKPAKKPAKKAIKTVVKAAKKVAKKAASKAITKAAALKKPTKTVTRGKKAVKKLAAKKPVKLAKAKAVKKSAKKSKKS